MKTNRWLLAFILLLVFLCVLLVTVMPRCGHFSFSLPVAHKSIYAMDKLKKPMPYPTVNGNRIIAPDNQPVVLRGVMPPDPAALDEKGMFNREYYEAIATRGGNVIRVAVHPERWLHDPDYLSRYLDPLVTWAQELGIYIIIDWHYIGNVISGAGAQMPRIPRQPLELTLEFWGQVAEYFHDAPHVMFEIFNEPESISAGEWRAAAQRIIGVIRAQGARQIVIVGGVEFGKDLSWVLTNPLKDVNLAYASHVYPAHSSAQWAGWFGKVAETYPVLMTEWGFMDSADKASQRYLVGTVVSYGKPLMEYLNARGIGWVACWYDNEWLPPMFKKNGDVTTFGKFVFEQLSMNK